MKKQMSHHITLMLTAFAVLCLTGCVTGPTLQSCATQKFPPAAMAPGLERKEAQEAATLKAQTQLLNQAQQLRDSQNITVAERMMRDPMIRQEVQQIVRLRAKQTNVVSLDNQSVTVYASIPVKKVMKSVEPGHFLF